MLLPKGKKVYVLFFILVDFHSKQVYQLFVRKLQEPGIVVVDNLRPSDKGKHLISAVEGKMGYLPSGCEFMAGSKKV